MKFIRLIDFGGMPNMLTMIRRELKTKEIAV